MTPQQQRAVAGAVDGLGCAMDGETLGAYCRCWQGNGADQDVAALLRIPAVVDLLAAIDELRAPKTLAADG